MARAVACSTRVSVEYFDDDPRKPLRLSEKQWEIMALPQPKVASRAGCQDKLVKEGKGKRRKKSSRKSDLGNKKMSYGFKYLGELQAGDGDL